MQSNQTENATDIDEFSKLEASPAKIVKPLSSPVSGNGKQLFTMGFVFLVVAACFCVAAALASAHHLFAKQGWMNPFDASIVTFVNRFANRSPRFDTLVYYFDKYDLLKTAPIVSLLWFAFFLGTGDAKEVLQRRQKVLATVPLAIFAVLLARFLADVLAFRERPLRTAALHFNLPHVITKMVLYGWSAFPSDHLALFTALSVGLLIAHRRIGILALLYTFTVISFPRLYLGIHWPTDMLAGTLLGVALASAVTVKAYRSFVWRVVTKCWKRSPGLTATFAFLLSYEFVELFATPIELAKLFVHFVVKHG